MPTTPTTLSQRLRRTGAAMLVLTTASCAGAPPPTASVAVPPIPAGEARAWFYRDAGPYQAQQLSYIRMNEQVVGILEPRGAFYRDVPPGHYHVAVDQYLSDASQSRDVDLLAGQQVYFKIVSLENWISSGGGGGGDNASGGGGEASRPTFYVWTIPPDAARAEVARTPFTAGS